jgi:hypothetical protein
LGLPAHTQEVLAFAGFVVMALFGGLIVLTKGSAVAPFVYTLF